MVRLYIYLESGLNSTIVSNILSQSETAIHLHTHTHNQPHSYVILPHFLKAYHTLSNKHTVKHYSPNSLSNKAHSKTLHSLATRRTVKRYSLVTYVVSKQLILRVLLDEALLSLLELLYRSVSPPRSEDAILVVALACTGQEEGRFSQHP